MVALHQYAKVIRCQVINRQPNEENHDKNDDGVYAQQLENQPLFHRAATPGLFR
jgi:hypothetical protein